MLFNSYEFILLFLPVSIIVYFFLNRQKLIIAAKIWLICAAFLFYSYLDIAYLFLLLFSVILNFITGTALLKYGPGKTSLTPKIILIFGIVANILLVAYFKHMDFFISGINNALHISVPLLHLILPVGIAFLTLTQIAYLVDTYRGEVKKINYLNYSLYITFFPYLLAGPIIRHKEMAPQFDSIKNKIFNHKNLILGVFLFSIGLLKKVLLADTFAIWANTGFAATDSLTFFEAWTTSLSYTFQLYFDFSGYTDMALGIALMFNIKLPVNFNSPYKALNIQDFWRRWNITLGKFFRDYIYIPLGGSKKGETRTYFNLFIVFLICGLGHNITWTFAFWGLLHGMAMIIHRAWQHTGIKLNAILAWLITFNFINITWVFFRAKTFEDAVNVLKGMVGMHGMAMPEIVSHEVHFSQLPEIVTTYPLFLLLIILTFVITLKNSNDFLKYRPIKVPWNKSSGSR